MTVEAEEGRGHIFKKMRLAAGMTPDELADKVNCARSHVYRIEKDESEPSLKIALDWVRATNAAIKSPALVVELLMPNEFLAHLRQKRRDKDAS